MRWNIILLLREVKLKSDDVAENGITAEMAEIGAEIILRELGFTDFGVSFSVPDLAAKVFAAMDARHPSKPKRCAG